MRRFKIMIGRLRGLQNAIARYPLTALFLLITAIFVGVSIQTEKNYMKEILSGVVGVFLSASLQASYERFFYKCSVRIFLMGSGVALTLGYYLIIQSTSDISVEISIQTLIVLLAVITSFIWIPVIHSKISFNESFMIAFKSFFHSLLYASVLLGGCILIVTAVDLLIVTVKQTAYPHIANIVFVLFAPVFFLSLIPVYPGERDHKEDFDKIVAKNEVVKKAAFCPKFLEVLISYIVIPLIAVFTAILFLYIVQNIREDFWSNNLLEPMLVSYAITVVVVYILSSRLENQFAVLFRMIFPKVLIPIVLFQIAASILSLKEMGITHTRYFVILFGIYAASAGVVMSLVPVRKNGILAAILIAFSMVSIVPPVDAFTVSRISQVNMLKNILIKNEMIENNVIMPNVLISNEDKKKIVVSVKYLDQMKYMDKIEWIPKDFNLYEDFYNTFGFYIYNQKEKENRLIHIYKNNKTAIDIAGYDFLAHTFVKIDENGESRICSFKKLNQSYTLTKEKVRQKYDIVLRQNKQEIIRFNTKKIFSRYDSYAEDKLELSNEEATFSVENNEVKLIFVVKEAKWNVSLNHTYYFANLDILVRFK